MQVLDLSTVGTSSKLCLELSSLIILTVNEFIHLFTNVNVSTSEG